MNVMKGDLASALVAAAGRRDVTTCVPVFFDAASSEGRAAILALLTGDHPPIVIDEVEGQLEELVRSRSPRAELRHDDVRVAVAQILEGRALAELGSWVLYPWLGRLVHVLPEALHREVRLDRNRYKITPHEQTRLLSLRIAVAGLSVGRAVVSTLVREGIGGELRLADFDALSLSNLNRVAGGLVDIGVSKVVLAAREIVELDPYLRVVTFMGGVAKETLAEFVAGADVVVDECDDLGMKILLREQARAARLPVVMATSDRGMLDVERFDLEPERELFHGMLAGVGSEQLQGLTTKQKVPYILRVLDAERLEDRMAASLVEVKESLSTWPQLASGVVLGGAMVASAVRRIALGELSCSGRFHADLEALLVEGGQAPLPLVRPFGREAPLRAAAAVLAMPAAPPSEGGAAPIAPSRDEMRFLVSCATLAPSGGNSQPWRFEASAEVLRAFVDPKRATTSMDTGRAALLALGGALESAMLGARDLGFDAVARVPGAAGATWELRLTRSARGRSTESTRLLGERSSNRRTEPSPPIPADVLGPVVAEGAPLEVVVVPHERLGALGAALAAVDRVRFMSKRFREDLFSELRWTREETATRRDGIDVATLELDTTDLAVLEVLRSGAGMTLLERIGQGRALGNGARTTFASAGAALVLRSRGDDAASLVDAGRGLLRLWLEATRRGLSVHPWGAPLLFERLLEAGDTFSSWEREALAEAAEAFAREAPRVPGCPTLLVLRLSFGDKPTARSLRRDVDDVLVFTSSA